jgi:hypothetical protein
MPPWPPVVTQMVKGYASMTTRASEKIIRIPADLDGWTLPRQVPEKLVWQGKKCAGHVHANPTIERSYRCKAMASKNAAESRSIR